MNVLYLRMCILFRSLWLLSVCLHIVYVSVFYWPVFLSVCLTSIWFPGFPKESDPMSKEITLTGRRLWNPPDDPPSPSPLVLHTADLSHLQYQHLFCHNSIFFLPCILFGVRKKRQRVEETKATQTLETKVLPLLQHLNKIHDCCWLIKEKQTWERQASKWRTQDEVDLRGGLSIMPVLCPANLCLRKDSSNRMSN